MTQAPAVDPPLELLPESFWGVILRRGRYIVAIGVSAVLFYYLGWLVAAPPPDMAGVSLLAWSAAGGLLAAAALAAILLVATFVCTLLIHPDSPHMGLFCALCGMAALSVRGGTVHLLFENAAAQDIYPQISRLLALECLQWAILFLIAEVFARFLHDRFFANTRWLTRSGIDVTPPLHAEPLPPGLSDTVTQFLRTGRLPRSAATILAFIINGLLASLFLYGFLQTPAKGQVLFACFAAFFLSTHLVYYAFPKVAVLALLLAIPVTAAAGYLISAHFPPRYPGHAGLFFGHALPIDYIAAGIPGAILGFYLAFHWDRHSQQVEADA